MTRLAASFLLALRLLGRWLGVRMLRTGRQRRVRGCFSQLGFQLLYLGKQEPNNHLRFRRLTGDQFFGQVKRHATIIVENPPRDEADLQPGCERLPWMIELPQSLSRTSISRRFRRCLTRNSSSNSSQLFARPAFFSSSLIRLRYLPASEYFLGFVSAAIASTKC